MSAQRKRASSVHRRATSPRGHLDCVFCAQLLAPDDCVASIKLPSRTRGNRYFGAHARCWHQAVRPEVARLIDLADVPPGVDHFLVLPA